MPHSVVPNSETGHKNQ